MPEVSIIVPVYKVEKYLDRCIESLIVQTISDIEIILVDDGSPDNCPSLCDRWAKKDSRIKVIHKENGGLGFARNSGLDIACGEYVGFVDSDDFVKHDMYEALYSAAKNEDADIAMCGFLCIGGIMTARSGEEREINCFSEYKCFSGKDGIDRLMLDISGALPGEPEDSRYGFSAVKNIYRRSILEENRLRFMSEREVVSEDVFFLLDFLMLSNRAVGIKGAYYCYCRNQGSLSKSYRADRFQMCCRITDGINERLGKRMSEDIYRTTVSGVRKGGAYAGNTVCRSKQAYRQTAERKTKGDMPFRKAQSHAQTLSVAQTAVCTGGICDDHEVFSRAPSKAAYKTQKQGIECIFQ